MILATIKMIGQFRMTNSAEVGGIFKSKAHFCLKVAQYCESRKSFDFIFFIDFLVVERVLRV